MSIIETIQVLLLRIIFSVVVPAGIILLCLYIFHSMADVKYLPASGMAFGIGFFVIYLVFKYVLKTDKTKESSKQLRNYFITFVIGLIINTEIIYLLVNFADVPLFTAQLVAAVVIAYESYYAYLSLLYRETKHVVIQRPTRLEDEIIYYDESGEKI